MAQLFPYATSEPWKAHGRMGKSTNADYCTPLSALDAYNYAYYIYNTAICICVYIIIYIYMCVTLYFMQYLYTTICISIISAYSQNLHVPSPPHCIATTGLVPLPDRARLGRAACLLEHPSVEGEKHWKQWKKHGNICQIP